MINGWQKNDINEAFVIPSNNSALCSQPLTTQRVLNSLPGAKAILSQAWALYKQRLGTFLGVMIIPTLVLIVIVPLFVGSELLESKFLYSKFSAGASGFSVVAAKVSFLIIFISQLWGETALLYAIKDSQEGIGVVEAYRRGWHKIFSYLWLSFLAGFIIIGGFLLFVIPGIIFAVWFGVAAFVLIAEDLKGMNALLNSREYVRGKWGDVFWRLIFISVLSFIIGIIPIFIFSFSENSFWRTN